MINSKEEWGEVFISSHPLNGEKWVATVAEIRHNATGIVREYQDDAILVDGDADPRYFIWEHGNYSCDCNRALFFARAAGEDEELDGPCSVGAYSVRVRNKRSGRVFYSEFV